MDVYSLGLLCYWVLAWDEETLHGSSDDADLIMRQPQAGKSGAILAKAISILGDMSISHPIRESLESFFKQTLDSDPKKRATSAIQLLPLWTHTGDPESKFSQSGDELPLPCPPPVMLPACSFNIRKSMAQLSVVDFRVRELIFQGLEQSMTSECGNCVSNNALQAYICCETGYGTDVSPEKAQGFQAKGKLDSGVISSAIQDLEHSHRPFEHGKLPFYITADLFHEYQLRGEVDAACERLHKEIEGMQNTLGPDHAVVNLFKSSLADVLYLSGKVQEAKITQKDVYESHLRVLGEGNPDTLRSMAQLALVLDYAGHNSEAIRLGEEALAISKKWLPMETRLRMSIEANLAGAYFHDGRFEDAERLQRSVVEVHEAELGSEHEDTVRCLINLSAFVNELPHPKRQDAIHISHRVWMVQKAVHGEQHRDTLQAHANYLGALSNAGNSELCRKDLVKQVREHLEAAKSFLGPDSIDTCMYAANLGVCLLQSDKMSEGREVLQETHSRLIELLGSSAWLTLDVGNHAARSLYYEGRYAEAEAICKEILTTGNLGADVSVELTFRARCTLGLCYEQGDHKEAISQFEMAAELSRQHWGSEFAHNDSRMIVSYLQDLYKTTGHWNSAIDLNRRLVEWVAPDDPRMLDYEVDLAGSYVKGGQSAKALESLPDLYERSKSRYGLLHHVTVAVQTHLTNAYSGCKMYKEAIEFSREVLSYMEATEESSLEDRLLVMNNLAAYLMETGSFSESEELLVRIKNTYEHECNHRGVCLAMHNLAALFHDQGQITEATLEQRKLVARYVDKHDTDSFDSVEESYYLAFYLSDDPGQKQEALQTAQKAWKSSYDKFGSNHVLTIKAAGLTGVIFRDLYELDKAKDFFEKELDGARDMVPCDDQDEYVRGAEEHMDSLSKQQQKPNPVSIIADANDDPTRSDLLP
ncbi:hypothetical protein F4780DRAFT_740455 [Xylariomycetidae sp. FL0641]|nr:hypothetical protein F4780DRAFT_740455 [Xylariomycetidae sp. FL0641]